MSYEYSPEEEALLAQNLSVLIEQIHRSVFRSRLLDTSLLCDFHRAIFQGVRSHAGRHRRREQGSEHLIFFGRRAVHRDRVADELTEVFSRTKESLRSLDENQESPEYEALALRVAAWTHARVIEIQPFEDGNKRTSRALMTHILVRAGLPPIPLEATRQEYNDAFVYFLEKRDIQPMTDLLLKLYRENLA